MILNITLVIAALVAALAAFVATRPDTFNVSRSITIAAPAAAVFPHVTTARAWEAWSPFLKADPAMKVTYSGPASGLGAKASWISQKVGVGSSTVVECRENQLLRFRLDMEKPMRSTSEASFTFSDRNAETVVTWTLSGQSGFVAKAFGLIFNCEKMVGKDFEAGLQELKRVVEREPAQSLVTMK